MPKQSKHTKRASNRSPKRPTRARSGNAPAKKRPQASKAGRGVATKRAGSSATGRAARPARPTPEPAAKRQRPAAGVERKGRSRTAGPKLGLESPTGSSGLPALQRQNGILPPGPTDVGDALSPAAAGVPAYQRIVDPDAPRGRGAGATPPARIRRAKAGVVAPLEASGEIMAGGALRSSTDPPPRPPERRNIGLRGAAPWVARHAAKHAAELRARNAEPPPPGSARATLRIPPEAEQIKAQVATLHQQAQRIRSLSKRLDRNFYEVGEILAEIQRLELHVAKGYSSFEAFLDREIEIGRTTALRLIRIAHTFLREMAYDYGIERLTTALAALDGELSQGSPSQPSSRSFSAPGLPARPPIRFSD